jgi:hypothetical protein
MIRTVLQLYKDEMQARSEPSTVPHFVRGDKFTFVTKNLFMIGQLNRKLRDRQLGPFTIEQHIWEHSNGLKLPTTNRLHPGLHVNNLRPISTFSLRHVVPLTTPETEDD